MATYTKDQRLIARMANSIELLVGQINKSSDETDTDKDDLKMFTDSHMNIANEAKYNLSLIGADSATKDDKTRVTINEHDHLFDLGIMVGVDEMCNVLEEASKEYKLTGIKLAHTIIAGIANERKLKVMTRNIHLAAKAGLDLNSGTLALAVENGVFSLRIQKAD